MGYFIDFWVLLNDINYTIELPPSREFKCNQCEFATSTKTYFSLHLASNHGGSFMCEKCDYVAAKSYELKIHVNTVHEDIKTFRWEGFLQLCKKVSKMC